MHSRNFEKWDILQNDYQKSLESLKLLNSNLHNAFHDAIIIPFSAS